MTQLPDQPPALLRMWWSVPNWCRLLPVLGGTLLAPMALVSVSIPPMSNPVPDIASAPTSPVGPETPVSKVNPTTPLGPDYQVTLAGQSSPITPSGTASTAPASHAAEPSPSAATGTRSPELAGTVPSGGTTTTPPVPAATPIPTSPPLQNDTSGVPVRSGPSALDSGKDGAHLADELVSRAIINGGSLTGKIA
ncbi:hypothetical protein ABZ345_44260 [Lentzea sp. NPDC005914]|uniref:hypothetical protein n=1 Tax=Lentzea sp. NPDC005914 TaxID=3154572 RepID=UPI0033DBD661